MIMYITLYIHVHMHPCSCQKLEKKGPVYIYMQQLRQAIPTCTYFTYMSTSLGHVPRVQGHVTLM